MEAFEVFKKLLGDDVVQTQYEPLAIQAINGSLTVSLRKSSNDITSSQYPQIRYVLDKGNGTYATGDLNIYSTGTDSITVGTNQILYLTNNSQTFDIDSTDKYFYFSITGSGKAKVFGDLGSIVRNGIAYKLFASASTIVDASELNMNLGAVAPKFGYMFDRCTSLSSAPCLSANKILTDSSFAYMFKGCTSLSTAPQVYPYTIIVGPNTGSQCCAGMFSGCINLTGIANGTLGTCTIGDTVGYAPPSAYFQMFAYCSKFESMPSFVVRHPGRYCCHKMFFCADGVAKDARIMSLWLDGTAEGAYSQMFEWGNVINLPYLNQEISRGGGSQTEKPHLAQNICYKMFCSCLNLTTIPEGYFDFYYDWGNNNKDYNVLGAYCFANMFEGCTRLTNVLNLPATELAEGCYSVMFAGCTSLTTVPSSLFGAYDDDAGHYVIDELAANCCTYMFSYCTALTDIEDQIGIMYATWAPAGCYSSMFRNCTALSGVPRDLLKNLDSVREVSYAGMFQNCTALKDAPVLPAESVHFQTYADMFAGCTSLTGAPLLPATYLEYESYGGMFSGCNQLTSLTAFFDKWTTENVTRSVAGTGKYSTNWMGQVIAPNLETLLYPYYNNANYTMISSIPFTMVFQSTVKLRLIKVGSPNPVTIEYKKNNDVWNDLVVTTETVGEDEEDGQINILASDVIQFRSKDTNKFSKNSSNYYKFIISGGPTNPSCELMGNLLSLVSGDTAGYVAGETFFINLFNDLGTNVKAKGLQLVTNTNYTNTTYYGSSTNNAFNNVAAEEKPYWYYAATSANYLYGVLSTLYISQIFNPPVSTKWVSAGFIGTEYYTTNWTSGITTVGTYYGPSALPNIHNSTDANHYIPINWNKVNFQDQQGATDYDDPDEGGGFRINPGNGDDIIIPVDPADRQVRIFGNLGAGTPIKRLRAYNHDAIGYTIDELWSKWHSNTTVQIVGTYTNKTQRVQVTTPGGASYNLYFYEEQPLTLSSVPNRAFSAVIYVTDNNPIEAAIRVEHKSEYAPTDYTYEHSVGADGDVKRKKSSYDSLAKLSKGRNVFQVPANYVIKIWSLGDHLNNSTSVKYRIFTQSDTNKENIAIRGDIGSIRSHNFNKQQKTYSKRTYYEGEFNGLFSDFTHLVCVSTQVPDKNIDSQTSTTNYCCNAMFSGCTSLTGLSSYTEYNQLGDYAYANMFKGCTALKASSSSSSRKLVIKQTGSNTCKSMYEGCSKMTNAYLDIKSATKGPSGFVYMFAGCTRLTPLPSQTSIDTTNLNINLFQGMFSGCIYAALGPKFTGSPSNYIIPDSAFKSMFDGCVRLTNLDSFFITVTNTACDVSDHAFEYMFYDCSTFKLPAISVTQNEYGINIDNVNSITIFKCISFQRNSYNAMFHGCDRITYVPRLDYTPVVSNEIMYAADGGYHAAFDSSNYNIKHVFINCNNIDLEDLVPDVSTPGHYIWVPENYHGYDGNFNGWDIIKTPLFVDDAV